MMPSTEGVDGIRGRTLRDGRMCGRGSIFTSSRERKGFRAGSLDQGRQFQPPASRSGRARARIFKNILISVVGQTAGSGGAGNPWPIFLGDRWPKMAGHPFFIKSFRTPARKGPCARPYTHCGEMTRTAITISTTCRLLIFLSWWGLNGQPLVTQGMRRMMPQTEAGTMTGPQQDGAGPQTWMWPSRGHVLLPGTDEEWIPPPIPLLPVRSIRFSGH